MFRCFDIFAGHQQRAMLRSDPANSIWPGHILLFAVPDAAGAGGADAPPEPDRLQVGQLAGEHHLRGRRWHAALPAKTKHLDVWRYDFVNASGRSGCSGPKWDHQSPSCGLG